MAEHTPPRPWTANVGDIDEEGFRVIRAGDGRPLAYVAKELSPNVQDDITKIILHAPALLEACRTVFFAQSENVGPMWDAYQWKRWRAFIGPKLADLWMGWV